MSAGPFLGEQLLGRLQAAGTWVSREVLVQGLGRCTLTLDEALADLVVQGRVQFKAAVGYRLVGEQLARQAAAALARPDGQGLGRVVLGRQVGDVYRVGVAQRAAGGLDAVMFELALPMPTGPDALGAHVAQVQAVLGWAQGGAA